MKNLKNVLIVINDRKSQAKSIAEDLEKELKNRQIGFSTIYSTKLDDPAREEIQKPQIIFTIGGDGTFIYAARKFFGWEIPILGINAGRLGFLMEIGAEKIGSMLDDIVAEKANFMSRMMLEINVLSAGKGNGCTARAQRNRDFQRRPFENDRYRTLYRRQFAFAI